MKENEKELLEQEKLRKQARFAQSMISSKNPNVTTQSASFTMEQVAQALNNPYSSVATLQQLSLFFYYNNGIYQRLIEELVNIPLYDLYLSPTLIPSFSKKFNLEKMNKEYETIAQHVELTNYKYNYKWVGRALLIFGEVYLFKVEDKKGTIYKMIPPDLCRISGAIDNNLFKYSIDIGKLSNEELYATMPVGLQKLYDSYANGSYDEEQMDGSFLFVEDKNAIALSFDDTNVRSKAIPPMSYLFDKLFKVNQMEDNDLEDAENDNIKILHMKAPTDDEGNMIIDEELLTMYHQAVKSSLPRKIAVATNPLPMDILTLKRTDNQALTASQKLYEQIYTSSGTNSELFAGKRNSNESIKSSIMTDEMLVNKLFLIMENYMNYDISTKKKNPLWKATMCQNTYFNNSDMKKEGRENLALGIGRMKYLALEGLTPLKAMAQIQYESMMDLNQFFNPITSGFNGGGQEDNGRPSAESQGETKEAEE